MCCVLTWKRSDSCHCFYSILSLFSNQQSILRVQYYVISNITLYLEQHNYSVTGKVRTIMMSVTQYTTACKLKKQQVESNNFSSV